MKVDLISDLGEGFGNYQFGNDEEMMKYITSANIACGFHAGDPHVMRKTVELAKKYGVEIGAHPGFPDLIGFGRRFMHCTETEIKDYITYQMGALREFATISGLRIQHVDLHGALGMMVMGEDEKVARAALEAISALDKDIIVTGLPHPNAFRYMAEKMGIRHVSLFCADREVTNTGNIVFTRKGSEIEDYDAMAERALRVVKEGKVITETGEDIDLKVESILIHGDGPGAPKLAKAVLETLTKNGVEVTPLKNIV